MALDNIQLVIDYKNGNIKAVSGEAEDQLAKAGKKGGSRFASRFNDAAGNKVLGTVGKIGAAVAAIGGIALFKTVKDATALETINTQFETILKSSKAAEAQVKELQDFAATTPFQLQGLADSTRQLLSFGIAQKEIIPTLRQLGDLAAATGSQIDELTIPYGRLVSTQRLSLIELDKFADRGVNIYAELAKQSGRSLKTIRDDITQGRIKFEEFTTALNNLTGKGGLFFEATQARAKTLSGVLTTLNDNIFNFSANIGKAFTPLIVSTINKTISAIQDLNKKVVESFNVFEDVIDPLIGINQALITFVIAPLELVANIGTIVFRAVNSVVATTVAALGQLGGVIGGLLSKLGVFDSLSKGLQDFAETSEQTALSVNKDFSESIAGALDFPVADTLATKNEELRGFFNEQKAIIEQEGAATSDAIQTATVAPALDLFQSTTDILGASFDVFRSTIGSSFSEVQEGFKRTDAQVKQSNNVIQKFSQTASASLRDGFAKGVGGAFTQFGKALASGENAIKAFGDAFLKAIGQTIAQQGQAFILEGAAYTFSANPVLQAKGPGLIASGAALAAFGGVLGASGGGGSAGTAGGGGGSTPSASFTSTEEPTGEFLEDAQAATPTTNVTFNIDGNVQGDEEFIRDTVASIGEEAGKQGLVFNNFQTA